MTLKCQFLVLINRRKVEFQMKQKISKSIFLIVTLLLFHSPNTTVLYICIQKYSRLVSRIERIVWCGKPMLLLSASDGERGAKLVLETAFNRIKRRIQKHYISFL